MRSVSCATLMPLGPVYSVRSVTYSPVLRLWRVTPTENGCLSGGGVKPAS